MRQDWRLGDQFMVSALGQPRLLQPTNVQRIGDEEMWSLTNVNHLHASILTNDVTNIQVNFLNKWAQPQLMNAQNARVEHTHLMTVHCVLTAQWTRIVKMV